MNKKIKGILVGLSVLGNVVMVGNAIKVDTAVEEQIISGVVSVQEVVAEEKQETILEEEVEEVEVEKEVVEEEIEVVEKEVEIVEKEVEVVKEVEVEKEVIKEVKSEPVEVEVVVEEVEIEEVEIEEIEVEEEEIEVVVEEEIENKDEVIINNMFDIDDEEYVLALKATTFSYNDIGYTVLSDGYGSLYIVDTTLKNGQNYVGKIDGMTDTLVEYRESDFEFVYEEYFEEYSQEEVDWAIGRLEGRY